MLYTVASWLILQVADVVFGALELPLVWVRLVLAILILGFPLVMIVSWVYEMTPEGLQRESDVDRSQPVTQATGRRINILIAVLLVLAITVVAMDRLIPKTASVLDSSATYEKKETKSPDRSIAVLPFVNRSSLDDDVFFVDGIHDDILTQLARIDSLTVISRTSVEEFRATTQNMKEIGAALGVQNILEGGVQRAGDRVRINVQLIDVTTDDHLWADSYDRELTTANIFSIQSEISTAIAIALDAALSPEEMQQLDSVPTEDLAAMEAYFLGQQAMLKRTSASLADAEQHFKRAIDLDPGYALAYVGLAKTYRLQTNYRGLPIEKQKSLAMPLIEQALAINDQLGEAYIAMATWIDDSKTRETLYRKGIELAPSDVTGRISYGTFLLFHGRTDEGLARLTEAVRLDPLSSAARFSIGQAFQKLGRFDEAREQFEAIIRFDADYAVAYRLLGDLEWYIYGRLDDAMLRYRQALALDPGNPHISDRIAWLWSVLGDHAEADRWIERPRAIPGSGHRGRLVIAMFIRMDRGDFVEARRNAEEILADYPTEKNALWAVGLIDSAAGHASASVERYRTAYPALYDNSDATIDITNFWVAVSFARLLQETGNHARANRLLDRTLAYIQTIPRQGIGGEGYGLTDAAIYVMQGRKDKALAALRQSADSGLRLLWRAELKYGPVYATLHDEPEYKAIVAELEADMAAQLEHVHEMVANGELAPIPE